MLQLTASSSAIRNNQDIRNLYEAFDEHREELRRTVVRNLDRRTQTRTDPSDILQEAFIEALRSHDKFVAATPMPLFDWLRVLAKNMAKNANKFHVNTEKRSVRSEKPSELAPFVPESLSTPSHRAMKSELLNRKIECLKQMTVEENEIIRLRHQLRLSNDQVARQLGISSKAASKRYYRAIEKLRSLMDWSKSS